MCDSCVAWSVCKAPSEIRAYPCHLAGIEEPVPHAGLLRPSLMLGEEFDPISISCAVICSSPWEACPSLNRD